MQYNTDIQLYMDQNTIHSCNRHIPVSIPCLSHYFGIVTSASVAHIIMFNMYSPVSRWKRRSIPKGETGTDSCSSDFTPRYQITVLRNKSNRLCECRW